MSLDSTRVLCRRPGRLDIFRRHIIGIALLTALPVWSAHADTFDGNLRAPPIAHVSELRAMAGRISARVAADDLDPLSERTTLHADWMALEHQLSAAIDHRVPLLALADAGLAAQPDGSYKIDYRQHPQWWSLDDRMQTFVSADTLDVIASALHKRGFRERDIAALRAYLERPSWKVAALSRTKALAESFIRPITTPSAQRTTKPAVSRSQVEAFLYQKKRIENDTRRAWVAGAFRVLDRQRQRILVSFLMDQEGRTHIRPENPDTVVDAWTQRLSSDEIVSAIEAEIRKVTP